MFTFKDFCEHATCNQRYAWFLLEYKLEGELNENLAPSSAFWNDAEYGKATELFYLKDGDNVFDKFLVG